MLDILGWKFDREGPKSDSYSQLVSALGVQFKLDDTESGTLNVCNTEKRVADTTKLLEDVIRADRLSKKDALILRGKLAFCDAFILWLSRQGRPPGFDKACICKPFLLRVDYTSC